MVPPKKRSSATAQYSPIGRLLLRLSGSLAKRRPSATLMPVIRAKAVTAPAMTTALPRRMASSAAMKNVLSPISLTKMRPKAAVKPWGAGEGRGQCLCRGVWAPPQRTHRRSRAHSRTDFASASISVWLNPGTSVYTAWAGRRRDVSQKALALGAQAALSLARRLCPRPRTAQASATPRTAVKGRRRRAGGLRARGWCVRVR